MSESNKIESKLVQEDTFIIIPGYYKGAIADDAYSFRDGTQLSGDLFLGDSTYDFTGEYHPAPNMNLSTSLYRPLKDIFPAMTNFVTDTASDGLIGNTSYTYTETTMPSVASELISDAGVTWSILNETPLTDVPETVQDHLVTGNLGGHLESYWEYNVGGISPHNHGCYDLIKAKAIPCRREVITAGGYEEIVCVAAAKETWPLQCVEREGFGQIFGADSCSYEGFLQDGAFLDPTGYLNAEKLVCERLEEPLFLGFITESHYDDWVALCGSEEAASLAGAKKIIIEADDDGLLLNPYIGEKEGDGKVYSSPVGSWYFLFANWIDKNLLGRGYGKAGAPDAVAATSTCSTGDCPQAHVANCGKVGALWV